MVLITLGLFRIISLSLERGDFTIAILCLSSKGNGKMILLSIANFSIFSTITRSFMKGILKITPFLDLDTDIIPNVLILETYWEIEKKEMGKCYTRMVLNLKENGWMICRWKGFIIIIKRTQNFAIKENGKMEFRKDLASINILQVAFTKDTQRQIKGMAKELIYTLMAINILEIG